MKKLTLLFVTFFALMFVGCEETSNDPIDPNNPDNPNSPELDISVSVEPAGFLEAGKSLSLTSSSEGERPFLRVNSVEDMPQGWKLVAVLEVANNEWYENVVSIEGSLHSDGLIYVDAQKMVEMHLQLFGSDPYSCTVYYRVPLYAENSDGIRKRIGGDRIYYAAGQYTEYYNVDYDAIEHWYLVVDNVNYEIKKIFQESKNPKYTTTVQTNGSSFWYVKSDRGLRYGPEDEGNNYQNDVLYSNNNRGYISQGGTYNFEFEFYLEDNAVSYITYEYSLGEFPGMAADIFLKGDLNVWGAEQEYQFVTTGEVGRYSLLGMYIPKDEDFKIASASWSFSYGASNGTLIPGQTYPLTYYGNNLVLSDDFYGNIYFINNNGNASLYLEPVGASNKPGVPVNIYIRGGMTNWSTDSFYQFETTEVRDVYISDVVEIEAGVEFKIASDDWSEVNLGLDSKYIDVENQYTLDAVNAYNMVMNKYFFGRVKLIHIGGYYYVRFLDEQ